MAKNGNGWHQGDWTDPNDPDYIPKPEKLIFSNRNKGGIPTAIRTAAANEQDLRKFYGSWLIPHGFSEEYIMTIPLDKLENLFNDMMGT